MTSDSDQPAAAPKRHGGKRAGAGRKARTTDGGPLQLYSAKLDATTVRVLTALGNGELSEGIRRAARLLPAPPSIP
jgi:hypothetical protein